MSRACYLATHELYALDEACVPIREAFRTPYLVGSAMQRADFRDVDVRLMLTDEEFDDLFGGSHGLARWNLLSLALGDFVRKRSGLPVDFQIQRQTEANAQHTGPRNPLGFGNRFAAGGDGTPDWSELTSRKRFRPTGP